MNTEKVKGALILSHLHQEGPCSLGKTIESRGLRIRTLNSVQHDLNEIDPLRPDLLVVMGGPVGVYQADDYPFLKQEIEILKARAAADKPVIGICLGAQLLAAALGAKVYKGTPGQEVGWKELTLTEAGKNSPARHFAGDKTSMFHWHGDTFDLPKGAELLASSAMYQNQIYQYGQNALGVQCHPEVQEEQLKNWFVVFTEQVCGPDAEVPLAELRAQTAGHIGNLNRQTALFFNEWLEERGL